MSSRIPPAQLVSFLLAGATLCAAATAGVAQGVPGAEHLGPFVLERTVSDRWVHEGQHAGFVPFTSVPASLHLRLWRTSTGGGSRQLTLRHPRLAQLSLDATNRIRTATIEQPPITFTRFADSVAREDSRFRRLKGDGATLSLPGSRVWEVPFVVPLEPLVNGLAWADTLSFHADGEGMWERLEGVWRNVVVGDTLVAGRPLPLVQTEADIRYRSKEFERDAALDAPFEILRDVTGRLLGRAAVDTVLGVRAAGRDSALLHGTALLRTAEGHEYGSGVRYDMRRTWLLRDSVEWVQVRDSLREEERRRRTGMLVLPRTPLEERLRAGDLALADSLYHRWRDTHDPDERESIRGILLHTNARGTAGVRVEDRLAELRIAAGDSAGAIRDALEPVAPPAVRIDLIEYLDDPGRLWRLGIVPRYVYLEVASQLLRAAPLLEPDSARWPCAPPVCAAIIATLETGREIRLRDAALAGAFVRDPSRHYDRVVDRAAAGSRIARNALALGEGVGATWPAAPQIPMPPPGASWRTWLAWLGGEVRWGQTHVHAIRVYTARTGRDVIAELRAQWPPAHDSARLVIGTVLRGMNALGDATAQDLAAAFLAGGADADAARRQLPDLLRAHAQPATDELRRQLLGPLLDAIARGADSPWPAAPGAVADGGRALHSFAVNFHGVRDVPVFLLDQEVPPPVESMLPPGWMLTTREEWDARPLRAGGALVTFLPIVAWDGFVRIGWNWSVLQPRAENEAPSGFAGGGTLYLLHTPDGWVVVATSAWIT